MQPHFFSVIVPAYNEEKLLPKTIQGLVAQEYPKDRYEVIIVENGSTDRTFEIAKRYEGDTCRVYQSPKGVSRARNFGIAMSAPHMDCAIWLDADVFLKPNFLNEVSAYLHAHPDVDFGTASLILDDFTPRGDFWTRYINFTNRLIRHMSGIHIVRAALLSKVEYDEELVSGEDLKYSHALRRFGTYFFMRTDQAVISARRFLAKGYWKMFFINMKSALPKWVLKHSDWEVIR